MQKRNIKKLNSLFLLILSENTLSDQGSAFFLSPNYENYYIGEILCANIARIHKRIFFTERERIETFE